MSYSSRQAPAGRAAEHLERQCGTGSALCNALASDSNGVRAFIIFRDGHPVFEHYRADVQADDLQSINSVTKSVVCMLIGIALREGALRDLQQTIGELLPETREDSIDPRVPGITIAQLLTMTSGFAWDERAVDECLLGTCSQFDGGKARLRFILGRSLAHQPGTHFEYDSHAAHLLSVVLTRATGRTIEHYAQEKIFAPLAIQRYEWLTDEDGYAFAGRGLRLSTADMVKLGLVMAAGGTWQGDRLIDRAFVSDATRAHSEGGWPMENARYGYLWWVSQEGFFASGFGEQFIFVEPRRALVAAVTSDSGKAEKNVRRLFDDYVRAMD